MTLNEHRSPESPPTPDPLAPLLERVEAAAYAGAQRALAEHAAGNAPKRALLTGPELQVALNVSAPKLRELRAEGLPHIDVGAEAYRYELDRALEWMRARGRP